jgi:hypothetical protein
MKKLIVFVLSLISLSAFAQYPITQSLGSDSTLVTSKGGLQGRIINWVFTDTTQANTQRIKFYSGAQIYTTSAGGQLWVRSVNTWILIGPLTGIGSGTLTNFIFTNANGFSGTVANPTTAPNLTLSYTESDPVALAKTITLTQGYGTTITGTATQALSSNPSWTLKVDTSSIHTTIYNNGKYLQNITAYLQAGSNVTLSGTGTLADPYIVSSTGSGGTGSLANIGSGYRAAVGGTLNVKTLFGSTYIILDSSSNTNGLTFKFDTTHIHTDVYNDFKYLQTAGNLAPLFTTSVTHSTGTLNFALSSAAAWTILGNNSSSSAAPAYFTPSLTNGMFANQGTTTTLLHGNAGGNQSYGQVVTGDIANTAVTYGKIQDVTGQRILARYNLVTGTVQEAVLSNKFSMNSSTGLIDVDYVTSGQPNLQQVTTNGKTTDVGIDITNSSLLRFLGSSSGTIGFKAPASPTNVTYTWPSSLTNGFILSTDGSGNLSWIAQASGTVLDVAGTTNRISVSGTTHPVVDISNLYVGQATITTLGTVTTATWNATPIGTAYAGTPTAGTTGQVLTKNSSTNYDYSWVTPTTGTVTSVSGTTPISVATGTTTPVVSCATCVVSSSPGVGIAHFAGSTQTVTSSAVNLANSDVTGVLPIINGGTNNGSLSATAGNLPYMDGSKFTTLAIGTNGQLLRVNSGATALEYFTPSYITTNQNITVTATGDATGTSTSSPTAPSLPLVLATVNSNVGTFGDATHVMQSTVNAKGLTTAASNVAITFPVTGAESGDSMVGTKVQLGAALLRSPEITLNNNTTGTDNRFISFGAYAPIDSMNGSHAVVSPNTVSEKNDLVSMGVSNFRTHVFVNSIIAGKFWMNAADPGANDNAYIESFLGTQVSGGNHLDLFMGGTASSSKIKMSKDSMMLGYGAAPEIIIGSGTTVGGLVDTSKNYIKFPWTRTNNSSSLKMLVIDTITKKIFHQPIPSGGGSGADALGTYIVQTSSHAPANAQILASLGTGIVKNTTTTGVLSIAGITDYQFPLYIVKPSDYGANPDGTTDATAGVQAAINSGHPVYMDTFYKVSAVTVPAGTRIFGRGNNGGFYTNSNSPALSITGSNVSINNIQIKADSAGSSQRGVYVDGSYQNVNVSHVRFSRLNTGFYIKNSGGVNGAVISDCFFDSCSIGSFADTLGEYNRFVNNTYDHCSYGIKNRGGNNNYIGSTVINCGIGVQILAGSNDSHGMMVGSTINGSLTYAIVVNGITYGYTFEGCISMGTPAAPILVQSSDMVKFMGCDFRSQSDVIITSSTNTEFIGNKFHTQPTVTQTSSLVRWIDNSWMAGIPAGVDDRGTQGFAGVTNSGASAFYKMQTFSNGSSSVRNIFNNYLARGTEASPGAVVSGDQIFSFIANGHDGSAYQTKASIDLKVDGTVSSGVVPMSMSFSGSSTSSGRAELFKVGSNGAIKNNLYGSGTFTGTPTSYAAWDASGNLIETSGGATYTASKSVVKTSNDFTLVNDSAALVNSKKVYGFDSTGGGRRGWFDAANILTATATLNFGSTGAGTPSDLTVTVTGASLGDVVWVGVPNGSTTANGIFTAWVSSANTVTVRFTALSATEDPSSGTFRVAVLKF